MADIAADTASTPQKTVGGKVTIRDLADHLDLTKGTVSRALNGYSDISAETQKRVAEAAERLGYRPSTVARAIRTGLSQSLGLVLNVDEDNAYKPFLADFLDGISRKAGEAGWTLTVATGFSLDETLEAHRKLVAEKKVDGFILPRTKTRDARIDLLQRLGVPFVLYGRTGAEDGLAWYDVRGERAMRHAVERLAGFGQRRIAYVGGRSGNTFQKLRLDGYRAGLRATGLSHDPAIELDDAMSMEEGHAKGHALLRLDHPPTAIVCAIDRVALGVMRALDELGLVPGRDVSVTGYEDIPEAGLSRPPLTTFKVDTRQAGYRLADLLIRRIGGEAPETLREEVEADLVARQSDGPPAMTPEQIATHVASKAHLYL